MDTEAIAIGIWLILGVLCLIFLAVLVVIRLSLRHQRTLASISFQVEWRVKQALAANKLGRTEEANAQAARDAGDALKARHEPR